MEAPLDFAFRVRHFLARGREILNSVARLAPLRTFLIADWSAL